MRRWSRAVALLCIVYLVALLLFHRSYDPDDEDVAYNDYSDYAGSKQQVLGSSNGTDFLALRHLDLKKQLERLEDGMTVLENKIRDVKQRLAAEAKARLESRREEGGYQEGEETLELGGKEERKSDFSHQGVGLQLQAFQGIRKVQQLRQSEDVFGGQTLERDPRVIQQQLQQQQQQQQQHQQQRRESLRYRGSVLTFEPAGQEDEDEDEDRPVRPPLADIVRLHRERFDTKLPKDGRAPGVVFLPAHNNSAPLLPGGGAIQPEENYTDSSLVEIGKGVAVYAAYHDDRLPDEIFVRLIVILNAPRSARRVMCHFNSSSLSSTVTVESRQYELCENHKKKYLGFIFSCPVPKETWNSSYTLAASLSHSPAKQVPLSVLDVSPPEIRTGQVAEEDHQFRYNYSICVSPLFGSVMAKRLVEFLELSRMLGAQQVFFYDFQVSSVIERVLRYYTQRGWVTVLPWKLPNTMDTSHIWYHGQLVTNNDCLYRTMAVSAFTAFHDIDEFIVPHAEGIRTWGELLPPVFPNDTCGYSFKSAFYDPGVTDGHFNDDLMTLSLIARPAMLSKFRTKVMVAPRRVFEVGIHHISKQHREHWLPRPYDSGHAILHHYRECIRDYGMRCENWVKDTSIRDMHMPELKVNFDQACRTLRL